MISVAIQPVGAVPKALMERLASDLKKSIGFESSGLENEMDPWFAYDQQRGQHYSTRILERLLALKPDEATRIVGLTDVDLFIPILTFVFGEAQVGCCAALVSMHRLHQEFYGLPPDNHLLYERTLKETVHELGHTFGLRHCPDYSCVMRSSYTVDDIDLKGSRYCEACREDLIGLTGNEPLLASL